MNKIPWYRSIRFLIPVLLSAIIIVPLVLLWQMNYDGLKKITLQNAKASMLSDLSGKAVSLDYILGAITNFC